MDRQNKSSPSYTLILFDFFFPSLQSIAIVIITPSAAPRSSADVCVCKREGGGGSPGVTASAIKFCAGASGDHLQRRRGFLYIWCWMQADRGGITQHAQSQSHLNTGSLDLTSCSGVFIYIFLIYFFLTSGQTWTVNTFPSFHPPSIFALGFIWWWLVSTTITCFLLSC